MSFWTDLRLPCEQELLIGFYDLTGYTRQAEASEPRPCSSSMSGYFALTGGIIDEAGGRLIKTMGDAGWSPSREPRRRRRANAAGGASPGPRLAGASGWRSRVVVKLHLGPVAIGRVGSPGEEIIDVYGKTVNVAASLPSAGLAMSPAVFRSLEPATRQLFKKHTPPVTYIGVDDARPD
jgi:class 3 adenylate cyclase